MVENDPLTEKIIGAAIGAYGQELVPSGRKMAFVGGQDQR
jgi:hypothetical protein